MSTHLPFIFCYLQIKLFKYAPVTRSFFILNAQISLPNLSLLRQQIISLISYKKVNKKFVTKAPVLT